MMHRWESTVACSVLVQFKIFFLLCLKYMQGLCCTASGEHSLSVLHWELGCVVLYYFNDSNNNMADKDDHNSMMVSQIRTVEYRFKINF
jgi:hypothetical protein